MKVYLVRHGQTDTNINNLYNFRGEDINQNGIQQAHKGISRAFHAYFDGIPKDGKLLHLGLKNAEIKEYEL